MPVNLRRRAIAQMRDQGSPGFNGRVDRLGIGTTMPHAHQNARRRRCAYRLHSPRPRRVDIEFYDPLPRSLIQFLPLHPTRVTHKLLGMHPPPTVFGRHIIAFEENPRITPRQKRVSLQLLVNGPETLKTVFISLSRNGRQQPRHPVPQRVPRHCLQRLWRLVHAIKRQMLGAIVLQVHQGWSDQRQRPVGRNLLYCEDPFFIDFHFYSIAFKGSSAISIGHKRPCVAG